MPLSRPEQKKRLDRLFVLHSGFSLVIGVVAVLFPHLVGLFFDPSDELWNWHPGGQGRAAHLIVRVYGAMLIAQAWIVWNARKVFDARIRKAFVESYFACFLITFLALLRFQLTSSLGETSRWNWINILVFAMLSWFYGWFIFKSPITVFESLPKSMV